MSHFAASTILGAAALGAEALGFSFGAVAAVTVPATAAILAIPVTGVAIAGGLTIVILVTLFARGLTGENRTMRDIRAHHERLYFDAALDRMTELEVVPRVVAQETENRISQELVAEEVRRELERMRVVEEVDMQRRRAQEEQALHDQRMTLAEEEQRIAEREQELQRWTVDARQRLEEEQETVATGIQPIQWPTQAEFRAAQEKVQYSPSNFHFAIVGKAGCGKSSLINAFLNLQATDTGAAPTGITEMTLEIGRYPDPGTKEPRPWTVWFDIPGAGTQRISHWKYFTNQALFVFDIIILAIGDRFEETDCQIVRSCIEFKIPCFIVRSKADQHIRNMMQDADETYSGPFDSGDFYNRSRLTFIEMSERMVREELERAGLPVQTLYCVSKGALRVAYNLLFEESVEPVDVSHEVALVKELMLAAYKRRCASGNDGTGVQLGRRVQERTMGWARATYNAVSEIAESTVGRVSSPQNLHEQRQANGERTPWAKRVLYLPRATTVDVLQLELADKNPGLPTIFVAPPRMLGPKVALLRFAQDASIPAHITAFGKTQVPASYRERAPNTGRTSTLGSSVHTSVDSPPGSIYTPQGSIDTAASGSVPDTVGRRQ